MQSSRRQFIIYSTAGLASLTMASQAQAQAMLGEAEPLFELPTVRQQIG